MKIKYTPEAITDLSRQREFIEIKNPQAAARIAKEIIAGIKKLKDFPQMGVEVSRAPNPKIIRDLILGDYVARYLVIEDTIYILRIWHQKENKNGL